MLTVHLDQDPQERFMTDFLAERDRGVQGGDLAWLKAVLGRSWKAQVVAAPAVLISTWPVLIVGLLLPALAFPAFVFAGMLIPAAAGTLTRYDIDTEEAIAEITPDRRGDGQHRLWFIYLTALLGVSLFGWATLALAYGVLMITAVSVPSLGVVPAVLAVVAVVFGESMITRRFRRSVVLRAVHTAGQIASRVVGLSAHDRRDTDALVDVAKLAVLGLFGGVGYLSQ